MKIINIVPVDNLQEIGRLNMGMHMLLAHLALESAEYASWAKRQKKAYKIMDNSIIELGKAMKIGSVVEAALRTESQEIILPDVFQNGPATIAEVKRCLEYLNMRGLLNKFKLQAVCQGKDSFEFSDTFHALNGMPEIDVIGIPKVTAKMSPRGRAGFEYLWSSNKVKKEIHFLGLWYSWYELLALKFPERVRSVDTCLAAFQAKYDQPIQAPRPDGFSVHLTDKHIKSIDISERILEVRKDLRKCGLKI